MKEFLQDLGLNHDAVSELSYIIKDYSYAIATLDAYDRNALSIEQTTSQQGSAINYENASSAIAHLQKKLIEKKQATDLFGKEREQSGFDSSLNAIYQTFSGKDLYPSIEEKAAHLLYFIVKNHPFVDGNKRIGAFIFIWFLNLNKLLYSAKGSKRIADNALIALTLLVAESKTKDKDTVINLIVHLINKSNQ
ncbi:MAG: Fic family protein [Chromatiales bacterium]|nr:Fic family protein [Chromatiales bacterium]